MKSRKKNISIEDYRKIFDKYQITNSSVWTKKFRSINEVEGTRFGINPWREHGFSARDFFTHVRILRNVKDHESTIGKTVLYENAILLVFR